MRVSALASFYGNERVLAVYHIIRPPPTHSTDSLRGLIRREMIEKWVEVELERRDGEL